MPELDVRGLYFLPPLAIARLGGSDIPLESFRWVDDVSIAGAHRTVIEPAMTLAIGADGAAVPYRPDAIQFRDGDKLRPVAPFFELWVRLQETIDGRLQVREQPLTLAVLRRLGVSTAALRYRITLGNKKAERRTLAASCGFVGTVATTGDDHRRHPVLACSPHNPDAVPLVDPSRPIPLGHFQVLRPVPSFSLGVDLSVLRVRFTPAKGEVYGPPDATASMSKRIQEGRVLSPKVLEGRIYEIVPEQNRILNPGTPWSQFTRNAPGQQDPQPSDAFDGAAVGVSQSWGVIDDTCDGVIEADLVVGGQHSRATTRVISAPPDFAPDRRTFFSMADDLADRDVPPAEVSQAKLEDCEAETADLFQRVFEVAAGVNLDLERLRSLHGQTGPDYPDLPKIDNRSMTREDTPYVDQIPTLLPEPVPGGGPASGDYPDPLPYAAAARAVHGPLTDADTLLDFLITHAAHLRRLIRPPWGHFRQFAEKPDARPDPEFRDPRVVRDTLHDMRMPPYMRDSDENPLSLTWRQYNALMKLLDLLTPTDGPLVSTTELRGRLAPVPTTELRGRLARRVAEVIAELDQPITGT
jgi:hypothetical protein